MKQKFFVTGILLLTFSMLTFNACKKKDNTEETPTATTPDSQSGVDNRDVQGENDAAMNEINEIISGSRASGKSASPVQTNGICGFVVDSVKIAQDTLVLTYNGVTCLNRTRTGTIRLTWTPGTKWKNAGAVVKAEFINYKVVRASDQKSIQLNGTQYYTKVSGGTWLDLYLNPNTTTIVTTVTGSSLNATFEDNKTAVYNINRRITYTNPSNVLTIKAEGIGNNGTLSDLENYGTTRNGEPFTSQVITPIVWNGTCGGAVIQGNVSIQIPTKSFNVNFIYGVDTSGNPVVVGPNQCPYGWKLEWTFNGKTVSAIIKYF